MMLQSGTRRGGWGLLPAGHWCQRNRHLGRVGEEDTPRAARSSPNEARHSGDIAFAYHGRSEDTESVPLRDPHDAPAPASL
jgi:hypothetical protein